MILNQERVVQQKTRIKGWLFDGSSNYVVPIWITFIMIGDAIIGDIDKYHDKQRIIKVFDYQVNQERGDTMMKILNLICTEAHAVHNHYCQVNGALQRELLIGIVPQFIGYESLFLKDGKLLSTPRMNMIWK